MEDHTAYIYILSLYPFLIEFFFLATQSTQFTRPDIFCNVWKRWGDAVPMGKLLFLPVRLRDVNVPISWRAKFRLKVTCLFPCAVEGVWFVRSYKMKDFTRHTFRTKCNINFHHFFWRSADTIVLAFLIAYIHNSHIFCVICDGLRTCNFNFFIAFSCFSCDRTISSGIGICGKKENNKFVLPQYRRYIFTLHFPGLAPIQFQGSWFPKFCWLIFFFLSL